MHELLKFDKEAIAQEVLAKRSSLKANTGLSLLAPYALGVIWRRLERDRSRYCDYGPYWWAIKRLLHDGGYNVAMNHTDGLLEAQYCGDSADETVVMADMFRQYNLSTSAVGTRAFRLSEDGPDYILEDPDMDI